MEVEQKAFEEIKNIAAKEKMLVFPISEIRFDVCTDASDHQLRVVL